MPPTRFHALDMTAYMRVNTSMLRTQCWTPRNGSEASATKKTAARAGPIALNVIR